MMLCDDDLGPKFKKFIDFIAENNLSESIIFEMPTKGGISENPVYDLNLYKRLESLGINPKDGFAPDFKDTNEALEFLETGDVFKTPDSRFLKMKTGENEAKDLKISKSTYLKLFPPVERFSSLQGLSNDCYLLSVLNAAFDNEKTRYNILSSFEETENGVNVRFPAGNVTMFFKDCEITEEYDTERLLTGPNGLRMLEMLFGYEVLEDEKASGKRIETLDEINRFHLPEFFPEYKAPADYYREKEGKSIKTVFEKLNLRPVKVLDMQIPVSNIKFQRLLNNLSVEKCDDKIILASPGRDYNLPNGNKVRKHHAYQIKAGDNGTFRVIDSSNPAFWAEFDRKSMSIFNYVYVL